MNGRRQPRSCRPGEGDGSCINFNVPIGREPSVRRLGDICEALCRQDRASGQAMVEFLLILFPLVLFVGGVIQLGIGISDWQNVNRIANEGARWAATNDWPNCTEAPAVCKSDATCDDSLGDYLRCQVTNAGLAPGTVQVVICQPAGATPEVGEPVTVRLRSRVNFLSGDETDPRVIEWLGITIRGQATMRLETRPTLLGLGTCPP